MNKTCIYFTEKYTKIWHFYFSLKIYNEFNYNIYFYLMETCLDFWNTFQF